METIISIMLYLSIMLGSNSYTESEYDAYYDQNKQQIDDIKNDQQLTGQIWVDHGSDAIIIKDDMEL